MRQIIRLCILLSGLIVLTGLITVQAQDETVPQALSGGIVPCPMAKLIEETEGKTTICGQIEVPENWENPAGRTITIAYAVILSDNVAAAPDPIIYFEGGPGGSALAGFNQKASRFSRMRTNRDIIIWDQRGTTFSSHLFCPLEVQVDDLATYEERQQAADDAFAALNINAYSDPDEVYAVVEASLTIRDRSQCIPYFEAQGIDITQYSTANTVRDTIALMKHLGYSAYNLYGTSYGTTVVLSILDYYEKQANADLPPIRSTVVDGVFPMNINWDDAFIRSYNILRVFADCEADPACGAAYPNIRQRTLDLLAALESAPIVVTDGKEITLSDLDAVLGAATESNFALLPYLPRIVDELTRGETAAFEVVQAVIAGTLTLPAPEGELAEEVSGSGTASVLQQLEGIKAELLFRDIAVEIINSAILEAETHTDLFIAILTEYLDRLPSFRKQLSSVLGTYITHPEQRTREGLVTISNIALAFPAVAEELTALANSFTDEEVAALYDALLSAEFQGGLVSFETIINRVVDCNDRANVIFNDFSFAEMQQYEARQLINWMATATANYQVGCEQLGLEAESYSPPPAGVVSDVRTLVVNGSLDAATPVEWGEAAFETLTNAEMITLPLASHVPGLFSECGISIINGFFLSPSEPLNLSCVEALRPVYILPGDELPALPE